MPDAMLNALYASTHLILTLTFQAECYYDFHSIERETEKEKSNDLFRITHLVNNKGGATLGSVWLQNQAHHHCVTTSPCT